MKNNFTMLTAILLSALLVSSCDKDTTKPNTSASEYFPNSVGDYWEYDVYDSSALQGNPIQYSVVVSIVGKKLLLDNKEASIWQYQYPWGIDTNYVRIVDDTVKIFDLTYSRTIRDLEFPRKIYHPIFVHY